MGQFQYQKEYKGKIDRSATSAKLQYDPTIAKLFSTSLGPAESFTPPQTQAGHAQNHKKSIDANSVPITSSSYSPASGSGAILGSSIVTPTVPELTNAGDTNLEARKRKRKRCEAEDDLEGSYMRQLAREEAKEEAPEDLASRRVKLASRRVKLASTQLRKANSKDIPASAEYGFEDMSEREPRDGSVDSITESKKEDANDNTPQHESVASKEDLELDKASRTVFLANVSTVAIKSKAAKKTLIDHLTSFGSPVEERDIDHAVVSIRFRSTPFSDGRLPKKAAYAKKELMDRTAKSTNAYAVYATPVAVREAVRKLNGTLVLDRHLRVDSIAHPAKQDHRRCVFIGNLGFVDDESAIIQAKNAERKKPLKASKEPADYEEGLWRIFGRIGKVESVRLVRDKTTRVGKGFAYVQFADANAVEKALSYNGKQFPPMIPREIRVVRAKKPKNSMLGDKIHRSLNNHGSKSVRHKSKASPALQSLSGRANKLLARAAAAQLKGKDSEDKNGAHRIRESVVFEGHRASHSASKKGGQGKKLGKPQNRSSRRGAEFKRQRTKK
ncbi:MAG: hypothetical protein Q9217_002588 [Psora testacea]